MISPRRRITTTLISLAEGSADNARKLLESDEPTADDLEQVRNDLQTAKQAIADAEAQLPQPEVRPGVDFPS